MPSISMGTVPRWHAARCPTKIAVAFGEATLTWEQLHRNATRKAHALNAFGVRKNDRVTFCLPNGIAFFEVAFAIWMVGATPNPLSARLTTPELNAILQLVQPAAVIGLPGEVSSDWQVLPEDWESRGQNEALLPEIVADHWKIIASGGSTGRPKLIVDRAPAKIDPTAYTLFEPYEHDGRLGRLGGIMEVPGPMYHNGPFAIGMLNMFAGSTIVGMPRFDAEEVLRQIQHRRVEFLYLVPTMMHRIWSLPPQVRNAYDLSSLRGVLHLAAACAPWLKLAWIDWLGAERIWETYGSTEALANTLISGTEWLAHRGSVGRCYRGNCKVLDSLGTALGPNEIGELWFMPVGGPESTYEYIGAPRQVRDGWESIGDLGSMDAEGYLYIADRRSDLILRGGVNIYPVEIEAAIESHADVISAAVIGIPDADLGARVHAIIQVRAERNGNLEESQMSTFLQTRLSPHKIPTSFEFVDGNLRDDAGKLRRSELRNDRLLNAANASARNHAP